MLSSSADTPGARSVALLAGASITSWAIAVYLGGISRPTTTASQRTNSRDREDQ
jgi:hypothetical protein